MEYFNVILSAVVAFVGVIITYITCKRINYNKDNEYKEIEMKEE